jgi:hypothetical protein
MHTFDRRALGGRWAALILVAALAACSGGSDSDSDGHGNNDSFTLDTSGRLAIAEQNSAVLRIHDLDTQVNEASRTLENAPSALYTSPGGRYVVAMQRTQDQVQFVDGGIYTEDHGDHLHDYKRESRAMPWKLTGPLPTHYDRQAGKQAAIFMDGRGTASPAQNSSVHVFTDASIAAGATTARLDLGFAIHGLGEPVDDVMLTVHREADATDTLPTHLELYRRSGAGYTYERRLATRCNGMHGSFSSGASTVVGCSDGVLLVTHGSTVLDRKLATTTRVGTVAGHPKLPNQFIVYGNAATPATTRFYAIDGATGTSAEVVPTDWVSGRIVRAAGFDRSGQRWFVLDNAGNLTVLQRQGNGWATVRRIAALVPTMPSAAPFPAFSANGARDEVYLTDPTARQLLIIDSASLELKQRRELGFVASAITWVGIER